MKTISAAVHDERFLNRIAEKIKTGAGFCGKQEVEVIRLKKQIE